VHCLSKTATMARIRSLLAFLLTVTTASALPAYDFHGGGVRGHTATKACLRLRGGLAGGGGQCGPAGCGRALPSVLGFGAWQASQMSGGNSLYLPLAGLAGLIVMGSVADGTRGDALCVAAAALLFRPLRLPPAGWCK